MTTYTPTIWESGDFITDVRLNKIENRIEEIQRDKNIFYADQPVEDADGYYYFPNMPSWSEIQAYQDGGMPVRIVSTSLGGGIETRMLMLRNALPFIDPNTGTFEDLYNEYYYGGGRTRAGESSNYDDIPDIYKAVAQGYPTWFSTNQAYIIVGVSVSLYEGIWYSNGRIMMYYPSATSHNLYISRNVPGYTPIPDFPDDNGGNGDIIGPGTGSCGCSGGNYDRNTKDGTIDDADYSCGGSGGGPKVIEASSDYCGGAAPIKGASSDYPVVTLMRSSSNTKKSGSSGDYYYPCYETVVEK